ncbi:hypothetical protein IP91_00119 [Pseudoduganella lurida]|uniref:Exo-alpha-sialidase n=1 Tax=Pseudoduganella lurida TaxID=1036180 RepID=A0A562RKC5_9BURK|nr:hypothetical protein [Pseudoduganella lurida]TWI69054.1 hypothetical protein IP91_00119 [Pseudoduganella lurida]
MPTTNSTAGVTISLTAGRKLTISCGVKSKGAVDIVSGVPDAGFSTRRVSFGAPVVLGPYNTDAVIKVRAVMGWVSYTTAELAPEIEGGVPRKGVASMKSIPLGLYAQWPSDNAYLSTSFWPGAGAGRTALARVTGDPALFYQTTPTALGAVPGCTVTTLAGTSVAAANALMDSFGNVIGDGAASIVAAWLAKNGDIFFVSTHGASNGNPANRSALFRARLNASKTDATVGSDTAASNKRACIDIGRWPQTAAGPWSRNIRMLARASFLEATVDGVSHYYYCEYNVAGGDRVPGGLNDQCIIYRSVDLGATWEVFMELNTGGTNIIAHFHGAVQDPYTGVIYFMTGDFNTQNAVISYDGKSPKLAANTPLAEISSKPGFKCINNTELVRFTDLCFTPDKIFTLPDADTEAGDATSIAYVNTTLARDLGYIVSVSRNPERHDKVPPFSAIQHSRLGALFISFRQDATQQEYDAYPWYDLHSCDVETSEWVLIGRINSRLSRFGQNPLSFFVDHLDRVWAGITNARWDATLDNGIGQVASKSSSLCITMGPRQVTPYVFEGG